ncbi:hypothetical protein ACOT81_31425 [Streptomyces sp. WI04-05B]|uniref:hypothetical protein n=1 Tax=Streptomyces TaxID=1883 RepID=UPI0029B87E77|nr:MULTISPECIES: hypothetical protein [unclassified Streptomyces]MDX2542196.1 hypothetical protein [Streptomyces sp. WI04-05B]MDX2584028.1 hypothetical protein [Streptomyces sp. WI04-05A]
MSKISGRRLTLATALSVVATSAVVGLGMASPAHAVCTQSTTESPGCGSTSSPSPTTTTDDKPTDGGALPSSGPIITAAPSPGTLAPVSGAATVKGVFTLGNGSPLAGATVTLTPVDEVPADGSTITPTTVGTATTASDGSWSFTLPSTLPGKLQSYADDNGGVLSLEASFYGQAADGTLLTGTDYVDAGVATGSATTEGSAAARTETSDTVAIHPDADGTVVTPADSTLIDSADTADSSNSTNSASGTAVNTWQSADGTSTTGFTPDVVGGVDYSAVKPKLGGGCIPSKHVIKQHDYYTAVGEAHAYYDTTAAFEYNNTLSSTWGVATSVDGEHWSITGKVSRKNSTGHAVGFANQGPRWAKRFQIPVEYQDVDHQVACPEGKVTHSYSILPVKYDIPSGGPVARYGADVSSKDGLDAYRKSNPAYRAVLGKKTYVTITSGTSVTIGYAAKVFGVTISLDTEYGTSHFQKITAGTGGEEHDIWGAKGKISGNPGVIYSY